MINTLFCLFFLSIFVDYNYINNLYRYMYYLFIFIGVVYLVRIIINNKKYHIIYDKLCLLIFLIFILYTSTITIININSTDYKTVSKLFAIYLLPVIILFNIYVEGNSYIQRFYESITIVGNLLALLNLYEIASMKSIIYKFIASYSRNRLIYLASSSDFRTFSIFIHPIIYGNFLVILFWCNLFLDYNKKLKVFLQSIVLINIFFTKSRSSWVTLGVTLLLYFVVDICNHLRNRNIKIDIIKFIKFMFGGVLLILLLLYFNDHVKQFGDVIYNRILTVTNDNYNDISRLQRLGTNRVISDYMISNGIVNFLFGNGYNAVIGFMKSHPIIISGFTTTDNQFISFFYNFGFLSLALYLVIIISAIVKVFRHKNSKDINYLSLYGFLSISINMLFYESFGWMDMLILLIICMTFISINKVEENKLNKLNSYNIGA